MRTTKEITLTFKETCKKIVSFERKPMDADITAMAEKITPILMEIEYDPMDGTHNIWKVIASETHYTKQYGAKFFVTLNKKLYDDCIARYSTTSEVRKAEAKHTAKRTNCALYDAANKRCVQFIMDVVSET